MKFYDFLFELTENSENEGKRILCEETTLETAYNCLVYMYGFDYKELRFIGQMETWQGELLGLDTY